MRPPLLILLSTTSAEGECRQTSGHRSSSERGTVRFCNPFVSILGALGGGLAIGLMLFFSIRAALPLAVIPFATSIVTIFGSPKSTTAQPRALVGGHLLSTLLGLLVVHALGPAPWAAAMAVGLAMVAMHLTATFHPPAGIDPLIVVTNNLPWIYLVIPVGVGALLIALFAFIWHNIVARGLNKGSTWPQEWWSHGGKSARRGTGRLGSMLGQMAPRCRQVPERLRLKKLRIFSFK